jgi:methionyl aminopeptidase
MIRLKNANDLKMLRESGRILARTLRALQNAAKEKTSLRSLDLLARQLLRDAGAKPAFLGYKPDHRSKPYPAAICASVNAVVVHGLPDEYELKSGDLLKIDIGVNYKGFYTDAALTVGIGKVNSRAIKLIETGKQALTKAISRGKPGNTVGDISFIIQRTVEKAGFQIIKELTGHGTGFALHEEPIIYNFGKKGEGVRLEPGMVLAIEPMLSMKNGKVIERKDGSFITEDNSLTVHFEHTIVITPNGNEILTK